MLCNKAFYRLCPYIIFLLFVSEKVAFHVSLSSDIVGTTRGQTIVFNQVDTNLGGGYNNATGVFTAPVAGTYVFSLTFNMYYVSPYATYGELQIMINDVMKLRVSNELDSYADEGSASGTTVLVLSTGDRVYVRDDRGKMYLYGSRLTYFSGFLLA